MMNAPTNKGTAKVNIKQIRPFEKRRRALFYLLIACIRRRLRVPLTPTVDCTAFSKSWAEVDTNAGL